jgi:hypothetical protein
MIIDMENHGNKTLRRIAIAFIALVALLILLIIAPFLMLIVVKFTDSFKGDMVLAHRRSPFILQTYGNAAINFSSQEFTKLDIPKGYKRVASYEKGYTVTVPEDWKVESDEHLVNGSLGLRIHAIDIAKDGSIGLNHEIADTDGKNYDKRVGLYTRVEMIGSNGGDSFRRYGIKTEDKFYTLTLYYRRHHERSLINKLERDIIRNFYVNSEK